MVAKAGISAESLNVGVTVGVATSTMLEEEDKKKDREKILEEIIVENFPKMGKEILTQVQETQSPKQDKPKVKHAKTYINQINKDQTQNKY